MTSALHEQRLDAVVAVLRASGAESVLDLGCGPGPLLLRLLREGGVRALVGIDASGEAIRTARRRLADEAPPPEVAWTLIHGSFTEPDPRLLNFDAAVLLETLEHVEPARLSAVEAAVFARCRPATVIVTTPNREYNPLLGVPAHRLRHPDHRFEWDRARFRAWCEGVAGRNRYRVAFEDVGWPHPAIGAPTQMAVFSRRDP